MAKKKAAAQGKPAKQKSITLTLTVPTVLGTLAIFATSTVLVLAIGIAQPPDTLPWPCVIFQDTAFRSSASSSTACANFANMKDQRAVGELKGGHRVLFDDDDGDAHLLDLGDDALDLFHDVTGASPS